MNFILKKLLHCTDNETYHVTSPVQCDGLFKNKSLYGMGFKALHFNTLYNHYSTALYSLQCTTTTPLHCTHYTAPPLLHCAHYTARPLLHCTVLTTLHHHHSTALYRTSNTVPQLLHCTMLTTLHDHYSIELHHHFSTALYSLHCILRSSFNERTQNNMKRYKQESFLNNSYIK